MFALLIFIATLIFIFFPLLVIWALNTLFGLAIDYTFVNWFCVIVLGIFFGGSSRCSSKK